MNISEKRKLYTEAGLWPAGEWDNEPDFEFWQDGEFWCGFVRNYSGALCGYIGFDPKIRIDTDEMDVHGGITFSSEEHPGPDNTDVKHIPHNLHWIGFDCAHGGDFVPSFNRIYDDPQINNLFASKSFKGIYRNIAFVKAEIQKMKEQLLQAKEGKQ